MYQALYRKWRPQTFDQVVGQEHITETLKNQIKTGRLSHAYIFIGTRGTGKTTCARILARAVNCEHPTDGNPCGKCPACRGILDGSVLDVVELDAASNNGVDNVRALRDEAIFTPATVQKRVYIIDEVHMLSTAAFNALLKILEEPPEHLMFILATTELQKVPATILSRCQRHSFKRIESAKLAEYLGYVAEQERFRMTPDAAELIARLAEGGVRDALSLLDQCSGSPVIDVDAVYSTMGLAGNRRVAELLDGILRHDAAGVLKLYNGMWMDGKDPSTLLGELSGVLRDVLMMHVAPKSAPALVSGGYDGATLRSFAQKMTAEELISALTTVQSSMSSLRDVKNPKTAVELCLLSLCDNTAGDSIAELKARISRLEEQIKNGIPMPREANTPPEEYFEPSPEDFPPPPEAPEYEELDAAMFAEEQPEDAFLARRAEEKAPEIEPPKSAEASEPVSIGWSAILEQAIPNLPRDVHFVIRDSKKVSARMDGDVLRVEAEPTFSYGRINRPAVLQKLAETVSGMAGREIRVILSEMRPNSRGTRDINELKKFKEVKFI